MLDIANRAAHVVFPTGFGGRGGKSSSRFSITIALKWEAFHLFDFLTVV